MRKELQKMSNWIVRGGAVLSGTVSGQGSKNAALPILAATLLVEEPVRLLNCPAIRDVENMLRILESLGVTVVRERNALIVDSRTANRFVLPTALSGELRSSIFLLGSVLSRFAAADAPYPGGCEIGNRPIDLHLEGLKRLNAEIEEQGGRIRCSGAHLRGAIVDLGYPSVGATENIMLAAARADGQTTIRNAACEPEIVDLGRFLCACGFRVAGAGTPTIVIDGVKTGHGTSFRVMADRIVTGTYLLGAAITDILDGNYARKHNLVTDFGKLMDPIADKMLIVAAFVMLSCTTDEAHPRYLLHPVVTIVFIAREFLISGMRQIAASKGVVIAAGKLGKWKTTFQDIIVISLLLYDEFPFFYLLQQTGRV